jgi:hypothetical protein
MAKFFQIPFFLSIDDLIVGTVEAYNFMGWSSVSIPNTFGITAMKKP